VGSFAGLLKREWLEHRGAFSWVPAALLGIILLAGISAVTINNHVETTFSDQDRVELQQKLGEEAGEDAGFLESVAAMALDVAGSTDAELAKKMTMLLDGVAQPFHLVFILVAFFALVAGLYDERKDQSVLFWKSMPVSNWQTVASKLVFVVWCAPLVTIAAIIVAQFFIISLTSIFVEEGMGGRVWSASEVWLRPFGLIVHYLLLGLWALPFCGWVLLISASVSRIPILWIIGVPWLLFLLESILVGSNVLGQAAAVHFKILASSPSTGGATLLSEFAILAEPALWAGTIIGLMLLAGAVYFRGVNNEI
jgi:ABC-2 type transport system permease protein